MSVSVQAASYKRTWRQRGVSSIPASETVSLTLQMGLHPSLPTLTDRTDPGPFWLLPVHQDTRKAVAGPSSE